MIVAPPPGDTGGRRPAPTIPRRLSAGLDATTTLLVVGTVAALAAVFWLTQPVEPDQPAEPAVVFQPTLLPPPLTATADTIVAGPQAARGPQIQVSEPPIPTGIWGLPLAPAGLEGCDEMAWYRAQFGLPARFDKIGWRESRCTADTSVRTSCCVGQSQLWVALHLRDHRLAPLYAACGVTSEFDVDGPEPIEMQRHWCAAAAVYSVVGFSAWSTS